MADAFEHRVSDADRDAVVERLRTASGEGRITLDEFEERTELALVAKFPSELAELTADLPVSRPSASVRSVETMRAEPVRKQRRWLFQMMSGGTVSGGWQPGDRTISLTLMGGQTIDCRDLEVRAIDVLAWTVMGGTEIIVPEGATIDFNGFMLMGGADDSTTPGSGEPHIRIRGYGAMGGIEVRHAKRRERRKRQRSLDT